MQDEFDFDKLPYHVKENIFKCLPFRDIAVICTVDLTWLSIGNKVIRNHFFDLCKLTNEELIRLKGELKLLPRTAVCLQRRLVILRSYYLLEMLLCELEIVKVIWKNILYNREGNTCSLGVLLDELYHTFKMCKRRNLPAWREENEIESRMLKYTKAFFDYKLKDIDLNKYFGCLIVDFMDLMIDREYTVDVCYTLQRNICTINGFYKLPNPRYLNRPPQLQDMHSDRPSLVDKKKILQFFINLVRINNRVTLREEQYNKETEFSLGFGNPDQGFINIENMAIMNEVRDHLMTLAEKNYELKKTDGLYDIMASFQSEGFDTNNLDKGFSCYFHIICPLREAPIHVITSWNRIKQKIQNNLLSDNTDESRELRDLVFFQDSGNSSEEDDLPVQKPHSGETYVFGCTIKSSLLRHDITETSTLIIVEP
ncbi:unnamed protein product [Nezara viridula]|uniref:F-box domain-containing protein n=1 Tax=Nezara viridula TaxID=85310 RepID=A0A9P0HNS8_NEZVI|nr:unnamed protein product [Nezara viridula]